MNKVSEREQEYPASALVTVRSSTRVPLDIGLEAPVESEIITFDGLADGREHLAIRLGEADSGVPLVRLHSECLTGDALGSLRCDCGPQLREALARIHERGGYLLYLRQEGRGIGLYNKLDAYRLQDEGYDTYQANIRLGRGADERNYLSAAQMLRCVNAEEIDLLSNNPDKAAQLTALGIRVRDSISTGAHVNPSNYRYLEAKVSETNHAIDLGRVTL
ncbi:GTP cyclohydrolase II [Streptomyces griseocarneus]|nr:GTP cyclohydrolase II [Streptomyces griseocarneus]MBZ6473159.1 GTP cyclohydrolase II [Streptomyces griseocarneus]GHG60171.1 GTP cyclohydrolase-2 [Streptomyces griseocarneus]